MTTEREALDRIAALCDQWDDKETEYELVPIHRVRAILAEVTTEPGDFNPHYDPRYELGYRDGLRAESGGVLDRDQARGALIWMQQNGGLDMYGWDDCLNRLAACVRPVAIDRDALVMLLDGWEAPQPLHLANAVLALVQLVEPGFQGGTA